MRIMHRNQTSQGFVNLSANDEKPELPVGKTRAVRLRGLSFPTRVGSPRRASALRKAICDLFSDLEFVYWAEAF